MMGQVVANVVSPLGTALLLGLACGLLRYFSRGGFWRQLGAVAGLLGWAWLYLWSTPLASDALRGALEARAGARTVAEVVPAPVMVVLGGGVSGPRLPWRPEPDLQAGADRVWHAARLYKAGKAPQMVLSGGNVRSGDGSEAEAMRVFLKDLGVPEAAMRLEDGSDNTAANAVLTASMLAQEKTRAVILVTSALHMPRARRAFERAGLDVHPAPTDFEVIAVPFDLLRVLPDAAALSGSARAIKELVGLALGR